MTLEESFMCSSQTMFIIDHALGATGAFNKQIVKKDGDNTT